MKIFQDKKVELKPLKKTETYMRLKKCDAKQITRNKVYQIQ